MRSLRGASYFLALSQSSRAFSTSQSKQVKLSCCLTDSYLYFSALDSASFTFQSASLVIFSISFSNSCNFSLSVLDYLFIYQAKAMVYLYILCCIVDASCLILLNCPFMFTFCSLNPLSTFVPIAKSCYFMYTMSAKQCFANSDTFKPILSNSLP